MSLAALGAGRAAAFTPADVGVLRCWLRADGLPLADNDAVATWTDSSGLGNSFAQGTGGLRPTYKANIVNGKPVVRFALTNRLVGSVALTAQKTIFAVLTPTATVDGYGAVVGAANIGLYVRGATNKLDYYSTADHVGAATLVDGTFYVVEVVADAANITMYVDGTSDMTTATVDISQPFTDIGDDAFSESFKGDIAEVLLYNGALSSGNRAAVRGYLGTKYGVTVV